jgi:hypothetical protein
MGCLLLHGTWSHLWYIQRSVYAHSLICISYRLMRLITDRYFCHFIFDLYIFDTGIKKIRKSFPLWGFCQMLILVDFRCKLFTPWFLAYLSWKIKWAILIARCPSVLPSICLSVNCYIFDFFSRTTGPIITKLGTNHPWGEGILNSSNEGDCPSPMGDNHKTVEIHWIFFWKSSSPEPAGQISIRIGIYHPWVKGILNSSNKRPGPLQRGDNLKNA